MEWFKFIDRLAKLEFVTVPKRIYPRHKILECYSVTESILTWPYTDAATIDDEDKNVAAKVEDASTIDDEDQKVAAKVKDAASIDDEDKKVAAKVSTEVFDVEGSKDDGDDKKVAATVLAVKDPTGFDLLRPLHPCRLYQIRLSFPN